jgi:D-beta-D-heptose 7-phosphate kinase/D-beta-D-heptose 1-phosphate adenosyltransferase
MEKIEDFIEVIDQFSKINVLCIGDMMMDVYIIGTVSRISPEAPVPVVEVTSEECRLGGAANTMHNIRSLGGNVFAVGVVGNDAYGQQFLDMLKSKGINTEGIFIDDEKPTINKTRILAGQQQIVRVDKEKKIPLSTAQTKWFFDFVLSKIDTIDAIVISDYDKGTITEGLLEKVIELARAHHKPIVIDPKIKHFSYYKGATVVTPNLNEASAATGIKPINETSIRNMGQRILTLLECDAVLITRGKDGMSLFDQNGDVVHIPTVAKEVFDVSGAGDTVTGIVTLCLAAGLGMVNAAFIGNAAAGIVVSKLGTATLSKEELLSNLEVLFHENVYQSVRFGNNGH